MGYGLDSLGSLLGLIWQCRSKKVGGHGEIRVVGQPRVVPLAMGGRQEEVVEGEGGLAPSGDECLVAP